MERSEKINEYLEKERKCGLFIEPAFRSDFLKQRITDVITTYNPKVIIKAGIGSGSLLLDMASNSESYVAVLEQSKGIISDFVKENKDNPALEKIHIINGDFRSLPADYYAADLIIDVDNFNVLETAPLVDEFRRVLKFEGILLLATPVLNEDDLDGVYDELTRLAFPIHNDYYLEEDLITFLELNEFKFIKGNSSSFEIDIKERLGFFREVYGSESGDIEKFIEENREKFESIYAMKGDRMNEYYYMGIFMRKPLEKEK